MSKLKSPEQIVFLTLILIYISVPALLILTNGHPIECAFYRETGLYCPGCGITRSIRALLTGNILAAVYYHPFVPYFFITSIAFIYQYIKRGLKKQQISFNFTLVYIGITLIIVQWIVKNFLLIYFRIYL